MRLPRTAVYLFIIVLFFLPALPSLGQSPAEDSMLYRNAVYNTLGVYHKAAGDQYGLYNGSQYGLFPFPFADNGQPFFKDNKPGKGTVVYDNILYENVHLQFDEVQDALVMQDSTRRIRLLNQRVSAFSLFENNFIRIVKDSLSGTLVSTGFYDVLYKGNTSLLKKEEKLIREEVSTGELLRFIDIHPYYYIVKGNNYYSIKSKNGFLNIFKDRKKDLRQFMRKNKLNYRKDRDNTLTQVTAYYDQLIK